MSTLINASSTIDPHDLVAMIPGLFNGLTAAKPRIDIDVAPEPAAKVNSPVKLKVNIHQSKIKVPGLRVDMPKPSLPWERLDISLIQPPAVASDVEIARQRKAMESRAEKIIQRERQQEAERLRLALEEEKQRQLEEEERYDVQIVPPPETITGLMDNHASLCSNFQWLSDLYGCRVYISNMSETYLRDVYVTEPVAMSVSWVKPFATERDFESCIWFQSLLKSIAIHPGRIVIPTI